MINTDMKETVENEFLKELEEFISEEEAKDLGLDPEADTIKIQNPGQADFFLRLLNQANAEIAYINTMCDTKIEKHNERVNRFRDEQLKGYDSQINYYTMLLQTYAESILTDKKKSMKLPEGTIGIKKQADKIEYEEELVLDYLKKNHPEFIRTKVKEEIDKKTLKAEAEVVDGAYFIGGNEIEGIKVVPQPQKFYIKPTK